MEKNFICGLMRLEGEGKPVIVLVHGYGGSDIIFYRLYTKQKVSFSNGKFDGFGRSAGSEFNVKTPEDAEDFILQSRGENKLENDCTIRGAETKDGVGWDGNSMPLIWRIYFWEICNSIS